MSYNLFLDDERNPNRFLKDLRTWEVVRTYEDFCKTIMERGLPGFVSFDHDIHGIVVDINDPKHAKETTGYDCALWLIKYCQKHNKRLPNWQVHSMNPIGKARIQDLLISFMESEAL
jgi:hypothetical protein